MISEDWTLDWRGLWSVNPSSASAPHCQPIKGGLHGYTLTWDSQHLPTLIYTKYLMRRQHLKWRSCNLNNTLWGEEERKQKAAVCQWSQGKHAPWLDTVNCSTRRRPVRSGLWLEVFSASEAERSDPRQTIKKKKNKNLHFLKERSIRHICPAPIIVQLCAPDSTSISLPHPHIQPAGSLQEEPSNGTFITHTLTLTQTRTLIAAPL